MATVFGVPWADLTPEILQAFLAEAGGEPLRWEAKADDEKGRLRTETVRRELCAFANSEQGGYLLLGAKRDGGKWTLPGLVDPPADLPVWLSQVADGVDPRPEIDVRDWPAVSERGNVGVVWIPPVAEPPAIVKDGTIYHRVAGSSRPVTDGRLLAELFRRGDAARELAVAAASGVLGFLGMNSETYANFAFAGTGGPRGFASPLFTAGAVKAIESAATAAFPGAGLRRPAQVDVFSRFVHVTVETLGSGTKLVVVASRFGAVGIQFVAPPNTSGNGPSLIVGHEWPSVAWRTGLKVLEALKATGRLYVAIGINMRLGMPGSVGRTDPDFRDWVALGPPEAAELARITREIRRLGGEAVLDPDPVAAGAEQPDERSVDRAPGLDRLT